MRRATLVAILAAFAPVTGAIAQDADGVLEVGQMAPDFEIVGSTDQAILADPLRLTDFRGKTVVLAFFYRVRTPG